MATRKEKFPLPSGCQSVEIEFDYANKISKIAFSGYNPSEKYFAITSHVEETPQEGDLSILWDDGYPGLAVIAYLKTLETGLSKMEYTAANDTVYENAIRFRNEEQYLKVLGKWQENLHGQS
ncbi:MAG: hypothetical protein RR661_06580 [Anaerovoracaceae bacterium]